MVCASVIGPVSLEAEDLFRLATGADTLPNGKVPEVFAHCVKVLASDMAHAWTWASRWNCRNRKTATP